MSSNDSDAHSSRPSLTSPSTSGASHHNSQESPAATARYQELTNLPSVALPYAEDADAEGDAEAENYPSYSTVLDSRRQGGARWFSKELRCLLYGFGDDENPYTGEGDIDVFFWFFLIRGGG